MPLKVRLWQTNRAADSATETPSKTRRDFSRLQTNRQTPFPESNQARGWTEWRCPPRPSRGCSFADQLPQPSANKEQSPRIYESKNFTDELSNHELTRIRPPRIARMTRMRFG